MSKSARDDEDKVIFAVSPDGQGDGVPIVIFGIPKAAWERMKDGHTSTFDLTKIGLKFKCVMYGAETSEQAKGYLNLAGAVQAWDSDFSIQPKKLDGN